jgi:biopolymer transport protein ExbD
MAVALAGARTRREFALGQNHDMNVTPFVDVMLVLLIIFMVAAPLATTAIKVDLPPERVNPADLAQPVSVLVTADGRLFVSGPRGDQATTLDGLRGAIVQVLGDQGATHHEIFVRADQHIRYGAFMAVMDRLEDDGLYKVGLVGEPVQR